MDRRKVCRPGVQRRVDEFDLSTIDRMVSVVLAFAMAEIFHGNGFIAAFFGGLMLGTHTPIVRERIQEFGEAEGQQLALFVFLIFGLAAVPAVSSHWDGYAWMYAIMKPHHHPHAAGCHLPHGYPIEVAIHRSNRLVRAARNRLRAIPAFNGQRSWLERA